MNDHRPPASRRARINNLGEPVSGLPVELGPIEGFGDGRPRQFNAYVIDVDTIDFPGEEPSGGPAPIDLPAPKRAKPAKGVRVGWSLVIAAISDTTVGVAAIVTGSTLIGIISSVAVGLCSIVLVGAEAISHLGRRGR